VDTAERNLNFRIGISAGKTRLISHVQAVKIVSWNSKVTLSFMILKSFIASGQQTTIPTTAHFNTFQNTNKTGLISGNRTSL
jgi:hypothetical protein